MRKLLLSTLVAICSSCDVARPAPLHISIRHPGVGSVLGEYEYVMGSVSASQSRLLVNGREVPVHRGGGFLAFLPVPEDGVFELVAHAGRDTARVLHRVRASSAESRAEGEAGEGTARRTAYPERAFALAADGLHAPRAWMIFRGTKAAIVQRTSTHIAVVAGGRRLWLGAGESEVVDSLITPSHAAARLGEPRLARFVDHVEVVAPLTDIPPVKAEAHADSLVVTFAGATASPFPASLAQDPFVRSIRRQLTVEGAQLVITSTAPIFGFDIGRRGDSLVVRLRRPPRIDSRSPLRDLTVVVDAGHPPGGAVGPTGLEERAVTAAVAHELAAQLRARGARVVLTRRGAEPLSLGDRLSISASANGHAFVSIHVDAAPPGRDPFASRGTATYAFNGSAAPLAAAVQSRIVARLRLPDRGTRRGDFAVVRQTWMPAILCEGATLTIPQDETALRTRSFRKKYATGIREGIETYFRALAAEIADEKQSIPEIVESLRIQYPDAISVAPDGRLLLLKDFRAREFGLLVVTRADSSIVSQTWSETRQMGAAWRPDSRTVAFFLDSAGNQRYQLRLFDVRRGIERRIESPVTRTPQLAWSPNGERVAYIQDDFQSDKRRLVATRISDGSSQVVAEGIAARGPFAWSPDGQTIATVQRGSESSLALVRPGMRPRQQAVVARGEIRELVWPPSCECILSTVREPGQEFFVLTQTSLRTGSTEALAKEIGDIGSVLERNGVVWYHVTRDGETVPRSLDFSGGDLAQPFAHTTGSAAVIGFNSSSTAIITNRLGRAAPPRLFEIPLQTRAMDEFRDSGAVAAQRVDIRSHDGLSIPAYLWRAKSGAARRRLLVLLHGGPALFVPRTWDAGIQYALSKDVSVLALNYRGSTGYGASFEARGAELGRQVTDVLAALEYARITLRLDPRDIVLWGHSYGALVAARALAIQPETAGRAVLISLIGDPAFDIDVKRRLPVFAFHGRQDVVQSPDSAQAILGRAFDKRLVHFVTLDDEGHNFRQLLSWARVYEAALR